MFSCVKMAAVAVASGNPRARSTLPSITRVLWFLPQRCVPDVLRNWAPEGRAALLGALSPRAAARRQSDCWSVQSVRVRSSDGDGVRGYSAPGITYKMRLRARAPLRLPGLYPTKQTLYNVFNISGVTKPFIFSKIVLK